MDLLIIRHAIAADKDAWARTGANDDERPLTADGRSKMARNASGLRTVVPTIGLLASSPLVRARQTADIVAAEYGIARIESTTTLLPASPFDEFAAWLESREESGVAAVVGHEPHLGALATWLLTGIEDSHIELKKGAACLIRFEESPARAAGRMRWALTPGQLRTLAG